MKKRLITGITILLLTACTNGNKPKIVHTENNEIQEFKKDATLIEISDIPIHIDSTKYLIHPIGEYKISKSLRKISFDSSNYDSYSFSVSNFNGTQITGNFNNLKFEHLDSDILVPLTTKNIRIQSVSFLRDLFNTTKKQILVYIVFDKDTNRDNKLNFNDIKTLYISNIDGSDFTKLTSDFQGLIDWELLEIKNRLYFRSIEDSNKNGEFDGEDKVHYQFIDLNNDTPKVIEYMPI